MLNIIVGVGVILIVAILFLIFRIQTLVGVAKGSEKKRITGANSTNAILFIIFLVLSFAGFFWYSITYFDDYTLPIASAHGDDYEFMFWLTTAITGVVFLLTQILLFWFSHRYQFKEERKALFYPDNSRLEIAWTIVPAMVLAVLVFTGWKTWTEITDKAPEDAEVVEIMGYQFAWKVRYPGKDGKLGNYDYRLIDPVNEFGMDFTDQASHDDFIPMEIHLPVNKPVEFKIRAKDVLHSVFGPHFRMKMDAMPGMPTRFWFTPTVTTQEMRDETGNAEFNYEIACTEVCGRGHFSMKIRVVVEELEEYQEWYAQQQSFLSNNPEYLAKIPAEQRELAMVKAGIEETETTEIQQ